MVCTPFTIPAGTFDQSNQVTWNNFSETSPDGAKSVTHSASGMSISGPNGTTFLSAPSGTQIRHRFFGAPVSFLGVLFLPTTTGLGTRTLSVVDFTTSTLQAPAPVFQVLADSTIPLPFLQPCAGNGAACVVGAPTSSGMAGVQMLRSDTGATILQGPPPFTPNGFLFGKATATTIEIDDGTTPVAGPGPFPKGHVTVSTTNTPFPVVTVGGCPQPPSTKQFTLTNDGTDCVNINSITASGPFSVTSQSQPFPADIAKGQSMTVTVTFAPTSVNTFNAALTISTTPAQAGLQINCSATSTGPVPAFTVTPSTTDFGHVPVGTTPPPRTVLIKNTGTIAINISVAGSPTGSPFTWSGFTGTLGCGASQPVSVSYTPQIDGTEAATITVASNTAGDKSVTVQGEGCIPDAVIAVPPAPFPDFSDVRQGFRTVRFITIGNTGDGPLTFTASISGPDAALFGIMKGTSSITDVAQTLAFPPVLPVSPCGGPPGPGAVQVAVAVFADPAHALGPAGATLTIGNHNDPNAPATFTYALSANIAAASVVDVAAVFDRSGSMSDPVPGGGTKTDAVVQAGQLLVQLIPPDLGNRAGVTRFSTTAENYAQMTEITSANQVSVAGQISAANLTPSGATAIAAGAMEGLKQYAVPRNGPTPPSLEKAMVVLTDGQDNTAYLNPDDGQFYSIEGIEQRNPTPPPTRVATNPFAPPSDVKVYAVGVGAGQDIDTHQLQILSSGAGGQFLVADPTQPLLAFRLMKYFTQIFMDMIDFASISDPSYVIQPGETQVIEFDLLAGDVGALVVVYDLDGIRVPFFLQSPKGEIVDAAFVPPGFQLRSGFTHTSRFLDFQLPPGEPDRYAGRWKVILQHDGFACRGDPNVSEKKQLGFRGSKCRRSRAPIAYGIAIGAGSNFRLQAYVTPSPVKVGDPILLTGVVSEAGLPVTGCVVTVEAVSPNGQTSSLTLKDDGAHNDGEPDDGEYAATFTNTAVAGSYTFTFRATGYSHDNEPVVREEVLSKYVEGQVKPPPPRCSDDCCERLVRLGELEIRLLEELVKLEQRRR
jgi:hypothetical protein